MALTNTNPAVGDGGARQAIRSGKNKPAKNSCSASARQAQRLPASIYRGRERLGRIEPTGVGYRAINADNLIIGTFARFRDAVVALDEWRS